MTGLDHLSPDRIVTFTQTPDMGPGWDTQPSVMGRDVYLSKRAWGTNIFRPQSGVSKKTTQTPKK